MRTFTDAELIARGRHAETLLSSEAYHDAREALEAMYSQAILDSDFKDAEKREELFRAARALQLLHTELEAARATGHFAEARVTASANPEPTDIEDYEAP